MKLIRSFFGCFAILATAFLLASPASAAVDRELGVYNLTIQAPDFAQPDFHIVKALPAVLPDTPAATADRSPSEAVLGPIYNLSLETDGQSLTRFHMRC